jgi:uncharacterized protein
VESLTKSGLFVLRQAHHERNHNTPFVLSLSKDLLPGDLFRLSCSCALQYDHDCSRATACFSSDALNIAFPPHFLHESDDFMKLHLHDIAGQNIISGHGQGYVDVNGQRISTPFLISPTALNAPWNAAFESLTMTDFEVLLAWKPALVVFGAGSTFRFPDVAIMAAFSQARIGFEVMDTGAACRTYNVLVSEGRNVAAALFV